MTVGKSAQTRQWHWLQLTVEVHCLCEQARDVSSPCMRRDAHTLSLTWGQAKPTATRFLLQQFHLSLHSLDESCHFAFIRHMSVFRTENALEQTGRKKVKAGLEFSLTQTHRSTDLGTKPAHTARNVRKVYVKCSLHRKGKRYSALGARRKGNEKHSRTKCCR
jgi:hypothetical protein